MSSSSDGLWNENEIVKWDGLFYSSQFFGIYSAYTYIYSASHIICYVDISDIFTGMKRRTQKLTG